MNFLTFPRKAVQMSKWELQQRRPETVVISAKVPVKIKNQLDDLAAKSGLTVSNISAQCIIKGLDDLQQPEVPKSERHPNGD